MIPLLVAAADELLQCFQTIGRPACLIGGLVVSRWGEPRATQDVDATVLVGFGEERAVLDVLLKTFSSRDADPRQRAERDRLALVTASNGVQMDISFAAFPFEIEVLDRATEWQAASGVRLRTCSAEDLVLYKLVAHRAVDIHDVQMIVSRQGAKLDFVRIREWGARFAEMLERPDFLDPFEAAVRAPGRRR